MTIEQDIDFHDGSTFSSDLERGKFAVYCVLDRIAQIKVLVSKGDPDIKDFLGYEYVPPALKEVIMAYKSGRLSKEQTLGSLGRMKRRADKHLRAKGYNPDCRGEPENLRSRKMGIR